MNKTVLFIHQSAELYGSDKTLFLLAKGLKKHPNFEVIVVLPNLGPLKDLLEKNAITVIVNPVIKLSRKMFSPINIITLPFKTISSVISLNKKLNGIKIDIVHSNTLAVLLGAFYAKIYKIKHLWHVHEIIKKPKIVSIIYPRIVNLFSDKVIFNSKSSREFLCTQRVMLKSKSIVILNGLDRPKITHRKDLDVFKKKVFGFNKNTTVIGLVGRISKWKGQKLLLEAFHSLQQKYSNIGLVFVGSAPPNQDNLVEELEKDIDQRDLKDKCKIIPFTSDIWSVWDSIDCAVVPSIEPEPFGLVAVEAMLAKKPVVGSKHGGLIEIIEDNKTGLFFEPNNPKDLEIKLDQLLSNKSKMIEFGENGYKRAIQKFSLKNYTSQFIDVYSNFTKL